MRALLRLVAVLAAQLAAGVRSVLSTRRSGPPPAAAPAAGAVGERGTQLFAPRADVILRSGIAAIGVLVLAIPIGLMAYVRSPLATGEGRAPEQPMWFDHSHHVTGYRVDCRYCHSSVERAVTAGMPSTDTCVPCHAAVWYDGPYFEPIRRSLATGRPIPWRRVNDLPDHVYFNHAAHSTGGIGCESCHGRVDEMSIVRQTAPLSMGWCLECHQNPEPYRRPASAITAMGWEPSQHPNADVPAARLDPRALLNCSTCHR